MKDTGKIKARQLLLAFEKIKGLGHRQGDNYVYNTLRASMSHDGYTVTIENEQVSATVHFHNAISVEAQNRFALSEFNHQIHKLIKA